MINVTNLPPHQGFPWCGEKKLLMKKYFYISIFLMLSICQSCTKQNDLMTVGKSMRIHFETVAPTFESDTPEDDILSRTTDISGAGTSSVQVGFENGDTVGIFPDGGFQIPFKLPVVGAPVPSVNIVADGWDTKASTLYAVYSPFDFYNKDAEKIPWSYKGPQQQYGNDTKDHLGNYWFLASDTVSATVDGSGNTIFAASLIMMGAAIRCQTKVPVACTIVRMILVAPYAAFPTDGYYDLFDTTAPKEDVLHKFSSSPIISIPYLHQPFKTNGYTDHLTLDFPGGIALAANERIRGWFVSPEANLSSMTVELYLYDTAGNCYVTSKALTASVGNIARNSVKAIGFANAVQTTTPFNNLNPWEVEEPICPTCTPVAF